jgi:hypothetical protein
MLTIEIIGEEHGEFATYSCPKGCNWSYVADKSPAPAEITVTYGMSAQDVADKLSKAQEDNELEHLDKIQARVLLHVLEAHLVNTTLVPIGQSHDQMSSLADSVSSVAKELNTVWDSLDSRDRIAPHYLDILETSFIELRRVAASLTS